MITAVEVSRDLSIAKVYYQNYAGDPAIIAEALGRAGSSRARRGEGQDASDARASILL